MKYDLPILEGVFLRRYKRFFADVRLEDGSELTVHCPNSGSMKTCAEEGWPCRISDSGNPKRKLRHTLEQVKDAKGWIGVNPGRANALAAEAITSGKVPELGRFEELRREVKSSVGSRLDIVLEAQNRRTWIEIKSVSMRVGGTYLFPDAVTSRGLKHLGELESLAAKGDRAVMLFIVQRGGGKVLRPAAEIDPTYAEALQCVATQGVEVLALGCRYSKSGITIDRRVEVDLG